MNEIRTRYWIRDRERYEKAKKFDGPLVWIPKGFELIDINVDKYKRISIYHINPGYTARIVVFKEPKIVEILIKGPRENKEKAKLKLEKFLGFEIKEKGS